MSRAKAGTRMAHVHISCSNTLAEVEQVILDEGLEIQADRSDIKHKVRQIDPADINSKGEEDIDEVLEPKTIGEKKKVKSLKVVNKHKA